VTNIPACMMYLHTGSSSSMEQCPSWEAKSQEVLCLLWDMKLHYCVHNSLPVLSQMQAVHSFPPYFPKIHSNIIFPSTSRSSSWSLPFRFCDQNLICISYISHVCYMPSLFHPPWLDYSNNIWWSVQVVKLLIMQLC